MLSIPPERVIDRVRVENPWWSAPHAIPPDWGRLQPRPYIDALQPLIDAHDPRRAVVLLGPRRVGKTVLVHHIFQRLLSGGTEPTTLAYISLDAPIYTDLALEELLRLIVEAAQRRDASGLLVVFDEIQYLHDWERHLKSLVDTHRSTRFVASGSAAAALRLKSLESGAGRFTEFFLPPLTFFEYLALAGEPFDLARLLGAAEHDPLEIQRLNEHFVDYVNVGGYPEALFSSEVRRDPARFIRQDVIDKVLLRDLPSLYGINDIQELNRLFSMLAWNTAQEVSLEALSRNSGVAKNTIKRYVEYLQAAFLIDVLHRVDRDARRYERATTFKVFLTNPSMRAALFAPEPGDGDAFGALAETAVLAQFPGGSKRRMHYARWSGGRGEVDFVRLRGDGVVEDALEVKWSDRAVDAPAELAALTTLAASSRLGRAFVTTRTRTDTRRIGGVELRFVPTSALAYALGAAQVAGAHIASLEHGDGAQLAAAVELLRRLRALTGP